MSKTEAADAGRQAAVGADRKPRDLAAMRFGHAEFFARGELPKPQRVVSPSTDEHVAVRANSKAIDISQVFFKRRQPITRRQPPQADDIVGAARGQNFAVGADRQAK